MAARKPKPGKTRYRRSPDEMIADLKKKIEDIEKRKAAKAMKADPATKEANAAFRALTKAVEEVEILLGRRPQARPQRRPAFARRVLRVQGNEGPQGSQAARARKK